LLIAPPEDVPPPVQPAHGGQGGGAGTGGGELGGTTTSAGSGGGGGDSAGEGGHETSAGVGGKGGAGGAGAVGGGAKGGRGGNAGHGGTSTGGTSTGATSAGGTGGGAGEGDPHACTTNAECVLRETDAARCRPSDHQCVILKSDDCLVAYAGEKNGAVRFSDDNAIYVGALAPLDEGAPSTSYAVMAERLAIDEINGVSGGLPDGQGGPGRPLVLIVCQSDTTNDPDVVIRGIQHLGKDVEVQAVVAGLKPFDLNAVFAEETKSGRNLFYLNALAISATLTSPDVNDGRVWTLLGQPQDYAAAYGLLLNDLETYVRGERGLAPNDKIRVATVYTTDQFDDELYQAAAPTLKFNGSSAASQDSDVIAGGNYLKIKIDLDTPTPDIQGAVSQIIDFAPDIVISATGDPMAGPGGVIALLEAQLPSPRPYYMLSPYNATQTAVGNVSTIIATEPDAAGRFIGISAAAAADKTLQNAYATSFNSQYNNPAGDIPSFTDNFYDAVYYLAYAMYGASSLTGPGISDGMRRLIQGDRADDGKDGISNVFAALDAGSSVSLYGTLGPPDFNPMTGVRPATPGIFCFLWDDGLQKTRQKLDVLRYDPETMTFTGSYPCLQNFVP
jgi:hypothetical protein